MPGPINAIRFVHAAILTETAQLQARCEAELTADDARSLGEDVAYFDKLMRGHTGGEELGLFPKLAEKESQFAQTYLRDHQVEHAMFDDLNAALAQLAAGDGEARATVRRLATSINQHCSNHIAKENDLVLPWVDENFSVPEQGEMLGKILSIFTPQDMEKMLPWLVARLDDENATRYLGALGNAQPPEVFQKSVEWIKAGIPADQLARLSDKVEALR